MSSQNELSKLIDKESSCKVEPCVVTVFEFICSPANPEIYVIMKKSIVSKQESFGKLRLLRKLKFFKRK